MPDRTHQVVIGSGAAGLLSVIIANGLGKTCALVEQHAMGGDCLNVGCVPSKVWKRTVARPQWPETPDSVGVLVK